MEERENINCWERRDICDRLKAYVRRPGENKGGKVLYILCIHSCNNVQNVNILYIVKFRPVLSFERASHINYSATA
jgi:hypothetical protein